MIALNDGRTSVISNAVLAQNTNTDIYFDKLNTSLFEVYPVLISPNWVKI